MTTEIVTTPTPVVAVPVSGDGNPYPFGWRYVRHEDADGKEQWDRVALTLDDVLHPQLGDVMPEREFHAREKAHLAGACQSRLDRLRQGHVMADHLIDWGVAGLGNHSPDVSVFEDLLRPHDPNEGIFRVAVCGGHCILGVEIVSPDTRRNDVDIKPEHYHRVGVGQYILVDQRRFGGPRELISRRWTPAGWEIMTPDAQGRYPLANLGLLLGLGDDRLIIVDAETGDEIGDLADETTARVNAQRRADDEKKRADDEKNRADDERKRADDLARQAADHKKRGDDEKKRADAAEAELARLRAQLAQAGNTGATKPTEGQT
jgi:Uma2 family endonuclease